MSVTRSVSRFVAAQARRLSFQARLTLVAALAVAATVAIAAVIVYFVAQAVLEAQVDASLRQWADGAAIAIVHGQPQVVIPRGPLGGASGYAQAIDPNGNLWLESGGSLKLPITPGDQAVEFGQVPEVSYDTRIQGVHVRILTTRCCGGFTLQVARPLTEVDQILGYFKYIMLLVSAGGVLLAALLGRLIAQAALIPIYRLRHAVDHVTETGDMSQRVPYTGQDELGRLGAHFNGMLGALDQSLRTQRQLVADASHELRTPLASLRTNIEVLQRSPGLPLPERDRLLHDVVSQVEQLTRLIQDLIDLARGDQAPQEAEEVRLDWVVAAAIERAATNWPAVTFDAELAESVIVGQANRLDRAISNLLDNAGKWSQAGQVVEVRVTDHEVTVRDHGPGIDRADLPFVFDRFWRAPAARSLPGSGLGLSIVRQVAEAHGGTVTAELPEGGGTLMRIRLGGCVPAPVARALPVPSGRN